MGERMEALLAGEGTRRRDLRLLEEISTVRGKKAPSIHSLFRIYKGACIM
jgi:hypothetical protein